MYVISFKMDLKSKKKIQQFFSITKGWINLVSIWVFHLMIWPIWTFTFITWPIIAFYVVDFFVLTFAIFASIKCTPIIIAHFEITTKSCFINGLVQIELYWRFSVHSWDVQKIINCLFDYQKFNWFQIGFN